MIRNLMESMQVYQPEKLRKDFKCEFLLKLTLVPENS